MECTGVRGALLDIKRCDVLLLSESGVCYWKSLYLDQHGEEDVNLWRGATMYLNQSRVRELCRLFTTGALIDFVRTHKRIGRHFADHSRTS